MTSSLRQSWPSPPRSYSKSSTTSHPSTIQLDLSYAAPVVAFQQLVPLRHVHRIPPFYIDSFDVAFSGQSFCHLRYRHLNAGNFEDRFRAPFVPKRVYLHCERCHRYHGGQKVVVDGEDYVVCRRYDSLYQDPIGYPGS